MKITIGHLYPYELNLYGENGNIKALKYALEKENIEVEIINIFPGDNIEFIKYDFIYIGSGRKKNLDKVKKRLEPYKNDILNYINKDKIMLATGNSISIFEFLDLYKIEHYEKRKVADVIATTSLCNGIIKGFQNTEYLIKTTNNILFNIELGYGNNETLMEGYKQNNFYATSLIGPLLARNDNINKYFVDLLLNKEV